MSSTRDSTATFEGYVRGLFQSERTNMLRMSEVNAVDHQAMQHLLTEGSIDWQGFGQQITREANELLDGKNSVLIFDESGFAKKGKSSAGVSRQWNGGGQLPSGRICDPVSGGSGHLDRYSSVFARGLVHR